MFDKLFFLKSLTYRQPCAAINPEKSSNVRENALESLSKFLPEDQMHILKNHFKNNFDNIRKEIRFSFLQTGAKYIRVDFYDALISPETIHDFYFNVDRFSDALYYVTTLQNPSFPENTNYKLRTTNPASQHEEFLAPFTPRLSKPESDDYIYDHRNSFLSVSEINEDRSVFIRASLPKTGSDVTELDATIGVFMRGLICEPEFTKERSNITLVIGTGSQGVLKAKGARTKSFFLTEEM